jgi:hypothetical protein
VAFERALAVTQQIDASRNFAYGYALLHLGLLCLGDGHWEAASRYCDESIVLLEHCGDLQGLRPAATFRAWFDLLQGRAAAARARLAALRDRPGLDQREVPFLLPFLAWAHLALGEVAEKMVAEAVRRHGPKPTGSHWWKPCGRRPW